MFCKYCGKKLEENETVCGQCGQDNSIPVTEAPVKKKKLGKIVLACVLAAMLLAVLAWVVYTGVTGGFKPKENDIYYKESYYANADKALANREKVVASMGEDTLTNGQLQVFYGMQIMDYLNYYYNYEFDYKKPLNSQIYDKETGLTWEQYFLEKALNAWKQYRILTNEAKKANYVLPEEYQDYFNTLEQKLQKMADDGSFESIDAMLQHDLGSGCTLEDYRYYLELYYYGNLYFSNLTEDLDATTQEIEAYFHKNEAVLKANAITKDSGPLVDVRHVLIVPEGGTKDENGKTVYTDDQWEACRVKAQKIYDEYLAGDKTEDSFHDLAVAYSQDGNASSGGLYSYVYKGKMVEEFENWCFDESRNPGDTGLVKTQFGYHIMYYVEGGEGWIRYCRSGVISEKTVQLLEQFTAGVMNEIRYKNIVLGAASLS